MVKRLFDICMSGCGLILLSPVMLIAAVAVKVSSRGPVLYHAGRMGRFGVEFKMHKFRSMHLHADSGSAITAAGDSRVFTVGKILRAMKIDELPQLWNVFVGQMSIVGPRPEDPSIVQQHYSTDDLTTLNIRPGLTSPGSIYNYTHGESLIDESDPEGCYVERLLPVKLGLERAYLQDAGFSYDMRLICRTVSVLARKAVGLHQFADPPELTTALAEVAALSRTTLRSTSGIPQTPVYSR